MKLPKINDRITLGIVSGIAGSAIPQALNGWLHSRKIVNFNYGELASALFTEKRSRKPSTYEMVNGRIVNLVIRACTGVAITYILSTTGRDKAVLKGAGLGSLLWLGLLGVTQKARITKKLTPISVTGALFVWAHNDRYDYSGIGSHTRPRLIVSRPQSTTLGRDCTAHKERPG